MNNKERYIKSTLFGKPDRITFSPQSGRESTREAWHKQGLPANIKANEITKYAFSLIGSPYEFPASGQIFFVDERMNPLFEEKILEVFETTHIVQDWKGNICEIAKKFSPEYLRSGIDFVTRRWVKCPVENWDDWQAMKNRYNANDPARLPADASALGAKLGERTWPITFHFSGPFWQMREWLGFEQLCVLFYDDPDMVRDMVAFWTDYVTQLMENAFKYVIPDER